MTNDEINIQAAKALRWKESGIETDPPVCFTLSLDYQIESKLLFNYILVEELKFTTSRDWAWLLVDEVLKLDEKHRGCKAHNPFRDFYSALMRLKGFDYPQDVQVNEPRVRYCFEASPKQITLAALEVLEKEI